MTKKMIKYIVAECNKILKELKKSDDSVTKTASNKWWKLLVAAFKSRDAKNDTGMFEDAKHWYTEFMNGSRVFDEMDGFQIGVMYDTDHIQGVYVVLYSKERNKYIIRRLPAPTNKELANIFHEE